MNDSPAPLGLRRMLLFLIVLLTFEGMLRKMNIAGTSSIIFFLKDIVIIIMGMQLIQIKRAPGVDFIWGSQLTLFFFFLPVILLTAFHDPILAVFGAKGYLLYPVVGIALYTAFENASIDEIAGFYRKLALLIIPTTFFAIYEQHLPASHWLNESVGGASEEAFSAGGQLRVSSTFSFVAQYCDFLNAEMFILVTAWHRLNEAKFFWKWTYLLLLPLLVVSCYITGSRSAVVGNTVIIMLALGLSLFKFEAKNAAIIGSFVGSILLIVLIAQYYFPDIFAAYSAREKGHLIGVSSEIQQRVTGSLVGWMDSVFSTPFFGYGIGIMSNGSDQFSSYAATYRATAWTETDYATTLFEGGIYLVLVWYSYRYYIIFQALKYFLTGTRGELALAAAFSVAFVITAGFNSTLAIQPPIAIWWWLAVGTSILLWKKSTEASAVDTPLQPGTESTVKKIRGRSAYAERLHGRK